MSVLAMQGEADSPGRSGGKSRKWGVAAALRRLAGIFSHEHGRQDADSGPGHAGRPGAGQKAQEGRSRLHMFKPATYSVMHLMVAVTVAYALTRDWRIALGVGIVEPMVQTVAYTVHEHLWSKVKG